jgi:putative intracellular protease/amidase
MSRVLIVLTAADSLTLADGTGHPTGFWAEEFVVAHRGLAAAGHDVVIATPGGRPAPVDPASIDQSTIGGRLAGELRAYLGSIRDQLAHPAVLEDMRAGGYAAVVLPGGHGPMEDLAVDPALGAILGEADEKGTVIAPFCHGPAGLLSATGEDGSFRFAGRRVTAFTDAEERAGGVPGVPWLLARRLAERGAIVEGGAPWTSHVVVDRNLITGQNPQSSEAVTRAVLEAIGA